jgi:hypothetical protein
MLSTVYKKDTLETIMSEDLAVDVGLTPDSPEFKKFVAKVDSILQYGCTSVTRVVQDITDKCHTSELDIARQVIRACASTTTKKRQSKLQWWETYLTPAPPNRHPRDQQQRPRDQQQRHRDQHQRHRDQQQSPKHRRSMSPLFQRPRPPTIQRHFGPRSDRYVHQPANEQQNQSHKRRPMHLSFVRPNSGRSRGPNPNRSRGSHVQDRADRYYDDNLRRDEKRKRPTSPLFDTDSDVPTWPRSKRRRQY